jgi:hypothetical protein
LYQWINDGTLDSFLVGRTRFITIESVKRLIASHLAAARDPDGRVKLYEHNPAPAPPPVADAGTAKARRQPSETPARLPRLKKSAARKGRAFFSVLEVNHAGVHSGDNVPGGTSCQPNMPTGRKPQPW